METIDPKFEKLQQLSEGPYQAFLYDCDGTLADNMPAHTETYIRVAAEGGLELDGAIITELAGWPIPDVITEINKRYNTTFDPQEFNRRKYELFYGEYIDNIKPISYVVNHLKANVGRVRIAVVSGGSRDAITKTLQVLGIDHMVEVLVCAGETPQGKPYADPFLKAAELLGVPPETCLVFEDGEPGVNAAIAAGMQWIRIDKV